MQNNRLVILVSVFLSTLVYSGCYKNATKFFPDQENEGLSIFSNTSNNVASCFINGRAWRTVDRKSSTFLGNYSSEVDIFKQEGNGIDTLLIMWYGKFQEELSFSSTITLHLAMPSNFSSDDVSALEGKRIAITPVNGYFSADVTDETVSGQRGSGSIYFHNSRLDSLSITNGNGRISGIFEANFSAGKMEREDLIML